MTWKPEEEMGPQRMYSLTLWVRRLLVANLLVFLIQKTLLVDPSFLSAFGFDPLHAWERPWTFVTYMFLHVNIPHLVFNMAMLFMFGASVEDRMGGRVFILFYLLCGLGGATLSFLLMQWARVGLILGASGAILGVTFAFAWYWPKYPVFLFPLPEPIPARWLVTGLLAFDLVLAWAGALTPARVWPIWAASERRCCSSRASSGGAAAGSGAAVSGRSRVSSSRSRRAPVVAAACRRRRAASAARPTPGRTPRSIACSIRSMRAASRASHPPSASFSPKSAAGCARLPRPRS